MFKNICRSSPWIRSRPTTPTATTTAKHSHPPANVFHTTADVRCLSATTKAPTTATPLWCTNSNTLLPISRNMATQASSPQAPKHTNRLAEQKSPYLLQHAHNPVDWYPWGEEAIERARSENKMIFLSVGYSTCHWCHVMEHESFENEAVAAIMNANFVNVKVDREERPDIDKIYMQFLVLMNGSGGWPMSVWMTPDLAPITAGTYFPPHDRWGMPSFTTVLRTIASKWESDHVNLKRTGLRVIKTIQNTLNETPPSGDSFDPSSADAKLKEALEVFKQRFDQEHGGFGKQPKFPEVSRLNFLFHAYIVTKDADVLEIPLQTLKHIGRGGIHDHVFGGFARYSVDKEWHIPHFEKMLYDQGQLMSAYANAYKLTHDTSYLQYGDGIFRYLMKDLQHPGGGFYAGEDADSLPKADDTVKIEGAFYAWTSDEIKDAITANPAQYGDMDVSRVFDIYASHYDIRPTGNVNPSSDPHHHLDAKNILIVRGSEEDTASLFNITHEQLTKVLTTTNATLHKIRDERPRPHLDTKIICAWNGLVLSGLAKMSNCGTEKSGEYRGAAKRLVAFLRENFFDKDRNILKRSCYGAGTNCDELENAEIIEGFLDDYAFLIKGLLDYYKASLDESVLEWAKELQNIQDTLFWDDSLGGYFYSQSNSSNVIMRLKDDHDGAEPSANSVAARNLILLSHYYDDDSYKVRAGKLLQFFSHQHPFGFALPEMMCALMLFEFGLDLVAVVGPESDTTQSFVEICRKFYIPGVIILHVDPHQPSSTYSQRVQEKFKMINGKPTVYICHDKVCRMPVTEAAKLEDNLRENFFRNVI